jgi:hypothetical protein
MTADFAATLAWARNPDSVVSMIDNVIKVLEAMIGFFRESRKARKSRFLDLMEPIFKDIEAIHGDYMHMYREVQICLKPKGFYTGEEVDTEYSRKSARRAFDSLLAARQVMEPLRRKLPFLVVNINKLRLSESEKLFIKSIHAYFEASDLQIGASPSYSLLHALGARARGESTNTARRFISSRAITWYMDRHQVRWSYVCEAYAALRISALG